MTENVYIFSIYLFFTETLIVETMADEVMRMNCVLLFFFLGLQVFL